MENKKCNQKARDSKVVSKDYNTKSDKKKRRRGNPRRSTENNDYLKSTQGYDTPNVVTKGPDNDPKWYMNLEPAAKDYASLPFNQVLGLPADCNRGTNPNFAGGTNYQPGLMTIHFDPTIGMNSTGPTAPVNLAAQQLFTLIRRNKSGTMKYDKTDLMMCIMAMDSAYMVYEDLLRAYRVISTFNGMNRYYPNGIIQALGFNQNIQYQLSRFRGILDMFAYKLASVNIPDQLDIVKRHSWMCSNIYLDDDNIKGQSYAFVLNSYYVWVEGTDSQPTYLRKTAYHNVNTIPTFDLDAIETMVDNIMNPILGSEDIGWITGDMLTTFGENGMIKIRPVEDYAALIPVYSGEVLLQIRNVFSCIGNPTSTAGSTGNIEQVLTDTTSGPYLKQSFTISSSTSDWGSRVGIKPLLNFINEDTSPENVMVSTRLMTLCSAFGSGSTAQVNIYGTENVIAMRIWTMTGSEPIVSSVVFDQDCTIVDGNTIGDSLVRNLRIAGLVSAFNNSPTLYFFKRVGTTTVQTMKIGHVANICNYMYLDDEDLKHLHEIATMSLFTIKDYQLNDLR